MRRTTRKYGCATLATAVLLAGYAQSGNSIERAYSPTKLIKPVGRPDRPEPTRPKFTKKDLMDSLVGACKLPGPARYVPPQDWGERTSSEPESDNRNPALADIEIDFDQPMGPAIIDTALRSKFTRPLFLANYTITDNTAKKERGTDSQVDWINVFGCSLVYPKGKAPSKKVRPISTVFKKPTIVEPNTVLSITNKFNVETPAIGNMCMTHSNAHRYIGFVSLGVVKLIGDPVPFVFDGKVGKVSWLPCAAGAIRVMR